MNLIKICVWTCDMTSRSYFDKMNSTLGSVVHLAMFDWHITLQILLEDIHLLKLGLTGSCGKDTVRRVQFLLRTSALSSGWILLVKYGYSLGWLIDCCNCISVYLQLLVCIFDPKKRDITNTGPQRTFNMFRLRPFVTHGVLHNCVA